MPLSSPRGVALLVCGESRGFASPPFLAARRLVRHVVGPLERAGHEVHSLLCLDAALNSSGTPDWFRGSLRVRHEAVLKLPRSRRRKNHVHGVEPGTRRLACQLELEAYEVRVGMGEGRSPALGHVLLTRPDAIWYADLPPLSNISPSGITTRARALRSAHGGEAHPVPLLAASNPEWFDQHCRISGNSNQRNSSQRPSPAARHAPACPANGCILADDQFIAMPRSIAHIYFAAAAAALLQNASLRPAPLQRNRSRKSSWRAMGSCSGCLQLFPSYEAIVTQAVLDAGCSVAVGAYGFVLLPGVGVSRHYQFKQEVVRFVTDHVLGGHTPLKDVPSQVYQVSTTLASTADEWAC